MTDMNYEKDSIGSKESKKIFFMKTNDFEDVGNYKYVLPNKTFLNGISLGDYAVVRLQGETSPATVKRLWKLKNIEESENSDYKCTASFEPVCEFEPIETHEFVKLNLFVINQNLCVNCFKQNPKYRFFEFSIAESKKQKFDKILEDSNEFKKYVADANNYRKILKYEDIKQVIKESQDVQLYKDNDSWNLYNSEFIGQDLLAKFNPDEFYAFSKHGDENSSSQKARFYRFLNGEADVNYSLEGLWDLFCGTVKEKSLDRQTNSVRKEFVNYCFEKEGLSKGYVGNCVYGINRVEKEFDVILDTIFEEGKEARDALNIRIKDHKKELSGNCRNWSSYVNKYWEFKEYVSKNHNENHDGQESNLNTSDDADIETEAYSFVKAVGDGCNKIFYGIPGCGKSHYVNDHALDDVIADEYIIRTTFYQDYSYTDFVGQILPTIDENNCVSYKFVPGPFTKALEQAIKNPTFKVALVIEEINRGNAPAIFGDIFQLLDRDNGTSRYPILNLNIQKYLKEVSNYKEECIKIPRNLYIYATMNTSDQNVFTLDNAFKRRWKFQLIENSFNGLEKSFYEKLVPGFYNITWRDFVEKINDHILNVSKSFSSEDKRYFNFFSDNDHTR